LWKSTYRNKQQRRKHEIVQMPPPSEHCWAQHVQSAGRQVQCAPASATQGNSTALSGAIAGAAAPQKPNAEELAVAPKLDEIEAALDDVLSASRELWFADSYHLLPKRIRGSTTILQHCYDPKDDTPLIGKFFPNRESYDKYTALHEVTAVSVAMPIRHRTFTNDESIYRSPSGFIFPPFVILEFGLTLDEWRSKPQPTSEATAMFYDLANHLLALHNQDKVYKAFSPKNVMFMKSNSSWRLLRMERCAKKSAALPFYAFQSPTHSLQEPFLAMSTCHHLECASVLF
jgi:serine/threonine protein kinase